jgi:hypothetical protein
LDNSVGIDAVIGDIIYSFMGPRVCRARRFTRPVSFSTFEPGLFVGSNVKSQENFTFKWKVTAVRLQVTPNFYAVQIATYVQYKFATFLGGNNGDSAVDHTTVLLLM